MGDSLTNNGEIPWNLYTATLLACLDIVEFWLKGLVWYKSCTSICVCIGDLGGDNFDSKK